MRQTPRPQALGERALAGSDPIAVTTNLQRGLFQGQPVVPLGLGPLQPIGKREASVGAMCQASTSNAASSATIPRT